MYKSVHTSQGVAYMGVLPGCTNIIVSNDARYRNNIKFLSQKIETRKKWQHSNQQCAASAGTDSCRSILHFTVSRDKIISDILCGHGVGRAVVYCICVILCENVLEMGVCILCSEDCPADADFRVSP